MRYSGFSIGYNVSVAIVRRARAPYIATWLVGSTGNDLAPAYYVIAAAVVTLATVLTMRETAGARCSNSSRSVPRERHAPADARPSDRH